MIDVLADLISKLILSLNQQKEYELYRDLVPHDSQLTGCAINQAGNKIFTSGYDSTSKIWSVDTGDWLNCFKGHSDYISCLALSFPFEDKLATGSYDCSVKVWSTETGNLLQSLSGHSQEIIFVKFWIM